MIKLFFAFLAIVSLFPAVFPQTANIAASKKIAFVNGAAFEDEKTGITKLIRAYELFGQLDCFPLHASEISEIERELKNPDLPSEERKKSEARREILLKEQKENSRKKYERVMKTFVEPVLSEISQSLGQIAAQNNIIILRADELDTKGRLLAIDWKFDVTNQFNAFFNDKEKKTVEVLKLDVPKSRLAAINTNSFFDKETGIKKFTGLKTGTADFGVFCPTVMSCQDIFKAVDALAKRKGFSIVFDSSKNLPEEIREFKIEDLTREFISEYNQNNP